MAVLYLHAYEHVRGVDGEGGLRDDRTTDVHEGVKQVTKHRRRAFEGNHEPVALELLVGKVKQGDDTERRSGQILK